MVLQQMATHVSPLLNIWSPQAYENMVHKLQIVFRFTPNSIIGIPEERFVLFGE